MTSGEPLAYAPIPAGNRGGFPSWPTQGIPRRGVTEVLQVESSPAPSPGQARDGDTGVIAGTGMEVRPAPRREMPARRDAKRAAAWGHASRGLLDEPDEVRPSAFGPQWRVRRLGWPKRPMGHEARTAGPESMSHQPPLGGLPMFARESCDPLPGAERPRQGP
jgi:hypothetical protein